MKGNKTIKTRRVLLCLVLASSMFGLHNFSFAQSDLVINGISSAKQLRSEQYLAVLYSEVSSNDATELLDSKVGQAMVIRVVAKNWRTRQFATQWNQAIFINSDSKIINKMADEITDFTGILRGSLKMGDELAIRYSSELGTTVSVNDITLMTTKNKKFFNVLLSTWIGQRPPSSQFKQQVLNGIESPEAKEMLSRFDELSYSNDRKKIVSSWLETPDDEIIEDTSDNKKSKKEKEQAVASAAVTTRVLPSTPAKTLAPKAVAAAPKAAEAVADTVTAAATAKSTKKENVAEATKADDAAVVATSPVAVNKTETIEPAKVIEKRPTAQDIANEKLTKKYQATVFRSIFKNFLYPKKAQKKKQEGQVLINVTVNRDGELLGLETIKRTKYKLLNQAAKKSVLQSIPLPKAPKDLKGDQVTVEIPFYYYQ